MRLYISILVHKMVINVGKCVTFVKNKHFFYEFAVFFQFLGIRAKNHFFPKKKFDLIFYCQNAENTPVTPIPTLVFIFSPLYSPLLHNIINIIIAVGYTRLFWQIMVDTGLKGAF